MATPTQTFNDDFNKLDLGNGAWKPAIRWAPNGLTDPTLSSWSVNPGWGPTSAADANPFSTAGGLLSIAVKPTPGDVKPSDVGNAPFLSGELTSDQSFSQTYGYFEMRAKMPGTPGTEGAFWLLPQDGSWPPELDVVEMLGSQPGTAINTVHSQANGSPSANPHWSSIGDASKVFHTYGVDWQADKITWYVDGKQTAQEATPADMHKPMYMLIDTMSGSAGSWVGAPAAGSSDAMQVDYVRAWSSKPDNGVAVPSSSPVPPPPPTSGAQAAAASVAAAVNTLTLGLSEDAWQGNARFSVAVDGKALNQPTDVSALHSRGDVQDFSFAGIGAGPHDVAITFTNDAWGGTDSTDRNLWVSRIDLGSQHLGPDVALYSNGTQHFKVV